MKGGLFPLLYWISLKTQYRGGPPIWSSERLPRRREKRKPRLASRKRERPRNSSLSKKTINRLRTLATWRSARRVSVAPPGATEEPPSPTPDRRPAPSAPMFLLRHLGASSFGGQTGSVSEAPAPRPTGPPQT